MPIVEFSNAAGGLGAGNHKTNWVRTSDSDESHASDVNFNVRSTTWSLVRVDLSELPTNVQINAATLRMRVNSRTGDQNCLIYRCATAWGVTPTNEGISAEPPLDGAASGRSPFDTNTPATDPSWAGGGNISAADYAAAPTDTKPTPAVGDWIELDVAADVEYFVEHPDNNHGWVLVGDNNELNTYHSNNAVNDANRWILQVNYSLMSRAAYIRTGGGAGIF